MKKQLTTSQTKGNINNLDNSTLIFDAISKMNLEALVTYIDEDINIDDTPCKYTLLAEMKDWFDIFKSKGDTFLNQSEGKCLLIMCSKGDATRIFTGNNSGHQYTLQGKDINTLNLCNLSEGHHVKVQEK